MNNREKQLHEIERYKVLEELKKALEEDEKAQCKDLLHTLPSQAFYAIRWAIQFLESEEQNND